MLSLCGAIFHRIAAGIIDVEIMSESMVNTVHITFLVTGFLEAERILTDLVDSLRDGHCFFTAAVRDRITVLYLKSRFSPDHVFHYRISISFSSSLFT